jgi:hypothetical protein
MAAGVSIGALPRARVRQIVSRWLFESMRLPISCHIRTATARHTRAMLFRKLTK